MQKNPSQKRFLGCLSVVFTSWLFILSACQPKPPVTPSASPTVSPETPTPTMTVTPLLQAQPPFHAYAYGELLPDMWVPVQRSREGEGGWYVIIGTEEGWAQFLSQMGQPAEIWEEVAWEQEILIGALLGLREGRYHHITITDLALSEVEVQATISITLPSPDLTSPPWMTYPFHLIRVPRIELPLGPATFRFVDKSGKELAGQLVDAGQVDIVWLPGPAALYPTPTPVLATSTPQPAPTSTPVPNLRVRGLLLDKSLETQTLRIIPAEGNWESVALMEGTSLLSEGGQPTTLTQLKPGAIISILGYPHAEKAIRAAHIEVQREPVQEKGFADLLLRSTAISTIYNGYSLPLSLQDIAAPSPLTLTLGISSTGVLTTGGFVVVPSRYKSFVSLYNDPGYNTYPVFISTDSALHTTQMLVDSIYLSVRQDHLLLELAMLDREMFTLSMEQYKAAQALHTPDGDVVAAAARQNAAYFAVALSLLDPAFTLPDEISSIVHAELSLIAAAQGITISPMFDQAIITDSQKSVIDYGQFSPERLGVEGQALLRYAQAMAWHRAVTWRLEQASELLPAVLLAYTLNKLSAPRLLWERVHTVTAFFEGQDPTPTPLTFAPFMEAVWGQSPELISLAERAKLDRFLEMVLSLAVPDNALHAWVLQDNNHPQVALSFLGQPFEMGQYILQRASGHGSPVATPVRPSAVHMVAALGSSEAYTIAIESGDDLSGGQLSQVRIELDALQPADWQIELGAIWLYTHRASLLDKGASYPNWMRTKAWRRKDILTTLGHWVDGQRTFRPSVRPSDQPVTEDQMTMPWGYVEPQPEIYSRLISLIEMIMDGLDSRLMLSDTEKDMLLEWKNWLTILQDMARRELTGQTITDLEYQRLTDYPIVIEKLTRLALESSTKAVPSPLQIEYDVAMVVRAADLPDAQLVEAIGWIDEIYVVVERGRNLFLTRGGVYSYYEFEQPAGLVPNDGQWQQVLAEGQAPPRPGWMNELMVQK